MKKAIVWMIAFSLLFALPAFAFEAADNTVAEDGAAEAVLHEDHSEIENALNLKNMNAEWTYAEGSDSWTLSVVTAVTNPEIEDPSYGLEEAPYVSEVRSVYGRKAGADMQQLLEGVQAMFAGGSTPQEDKDLFFQAVMQAYMETKKDAQERFTPKKYKKDRE